MINEIHLDQSQAAELFRLLERDAVQIEELVEIEKQEQNQALVDVYRYLMSRRKEREETS